MINIPLRFEEKLKPNKELYAAVLSTISDFSPIIIDNKLEFFPEYTDHGEKHIDNVLSITDKFISDEMLAKISSDDIGVLILSIILHDLGMHISYSGLQCLLNSESYKKTYKTVYDDLSWSNLWELYIKDACLWSDKKRLLIFGDKIDIVRPPQSELSLTKADKMLYGEFLRCNHARLANDIAFLGFPMKDNDLKKFASNIDDINIRKIIGHIARSHGENLWDMIEYLKSDFGGSQYRNFKNINITFLMALLRIADYFDIDKDRANETILNSKKFQSVISNIEWSKHNCIDWIDMKNQEDPETIYIHINPPDNSLIFLGINDLLRSMQNELDTCWAVLGKVYGRYSNLGLSYRRIDSNLKSSNMMPSINYIPEKIKFDVNESITGLLVKPLYGDNPSYGIRELIQNAVDACIEKASVIKSDIAYIAEVVIEIEESMDGTGKFTIKDNGIGMTKEILINYFLKAGASYRNSDYWTKNFLDGNNNAKILRNGKFGVGVFASFLLGEKISVSTSPYGQKNSYNFSATIESEQLDVLYYEKELEVSGTQISIILSAETLKTLKNQLDRVNYYYHPYSENNLSWHLWYNFDNPKLHITLPDGWRIKNIEKNLFKISLDKNDSEEVNSLYPENFQRVDWSYKVRNSLLICNGIIIPQGYQLERYRFPSSINKPMVAVIDRNAKLPLTLNRNALGNNKLPFEKELLEDIFKDMIAKMLSYENVSWISKEKYKMHNVLFKHDAFSKESSLQDKFMRIEDFILNMDGYCISHAYNIDRLNDSSFIKIYTDESNDGKLEFEQLGFKRNNIIFSKDHPNAIYDYKYCLDPNHTINFGSDYNLEIMHAYVKKDKYEYLIEDGKKRMRASFTEKYVIVEESDNWVLIAPKGIRISNINIDKIDSMMKGVHLIIEYRYLNSPVSTNPYDRFYETTLFTDLMTEYIGEQIIIPYELEKRKQLYPKAFNELEKYMNSLQKH